MLGTRPRALLPTMVEVAKSKSETEIWRLQTIRVTQNSGHRGVNMIYISGAYKRQEFSVLMSTLTVRLSVNLARG